jgi:hypothetical protein
MFALQTAQFVLFNHLVGAGEQRRQHREAKHECLCALVTSSNFDD